eukprot:GFKZ01004010.1.p1 GENE.GFKZ01004010.1~~GFKZ01004010.1.p1  ORF type:complete len:1659 (+),score=262.28 GFKZ01004010.1:291-5267(+)
MDPPPFSPPLSVSCLALRNLHTLSYIRYTPDPNLPQSTQPSVLPRARFLEHGIGRSVALPIAAAALLSDSLPAALPALLPPSSPKLPNKPTLIPPTLWVFAPPHILPRASSLLADAFSPSPPTPWTPSSPQHVTNALLQALRRAIENSLHAAGALSLRDTIVNPATNLAYTISLTHPPRATHALLRLRIRHSTWRHVTDLDHPTAGSLPLQVVAAPFCTRASLAMRPPAGDALTESVLKRWREAGLLPLDDLMDSMVIFLKLPGGAEVPFPRAMILTNAPRGEERPVTGKNKLQEARGEETPRKEKARGTVTPRSKKRPRSPPAVEKELTKDVGIAKGKDPLQAKADEFAANAPTSETINQALERAKKDGLVDAVPVLLHPTAEEIVPPSFISADVEKEETGDLVEKRESEKERVPKEGVDFMNGASGGQIVEKPDEAPPAKPEVKRPESTDGIDMFLMGGDGGSAQTGYDAGPSMDITDFTAFDNDITEFFQDGIEDRLQGTGSSLGNTDDGGRSVEQSQGLGGYRMTEQDTGLLQVGADAVKRQLKDSQMEVDTDLQKSVRDESGASLCAQNGQNPQNFVALALSSLKAPGIVARPDEKVMGARLTQFFEDDLTDRRLVRLGAAGSIGKRVPRSKTIAKRALVRIKEDFNSRRRGRFQTMLAPATRYKLAPEVCYKLKPSNLPTNSMDVYIPRRKLKAYTKLRKRGLPIKSRAELGQYESDSGSENEDDSDEEVSIPPTRDPVRGQTKLPPGMGQRKDDDLWRNDEHIETDPLKIVDSVAVDCASACMMLAAGHLCQQSRGIASGNFGSSPPDGIGSQSAHREEDLAKGTGANITDSKLPSVSYPARAQLLTQTGSPIARGMASPKREREVLAMLFLLEMQAFSVKDLELFREDAVLSDSARFALNVLNPKGASGSCADHAQPATVRRVLLGLPRLLETSKVFGSCSEAMRKDDEDAVTIKIQGPLPVRDVVGDEAALFPLQLPRVCVGFNREWIETPSDVLHLWEKAGLEPYSEKKNVEYVAVAPKEMEPDVRLFLRDLSASYEECSFGRHAAMPFDGITLISNSASKSDRNRLKNPDLLSEFDKAMAKQYLLTITGLCTKLAAVTREHRKNPNGAAMNIVVYVISPFENSETAANVALLKAVSPLVSTIPGAVPSTTSMIGSSSPGITLPSAPWRCTSASKGIVSITVRIVPREVVDRQLSGHAEIECLLHRPLRPQLVKALSFSVFSSIRSKRVKTSKVDGEVAGMLTRTSLMPDDLMSPMTPEIVAESPGGGTTGTPVSPKSSGNDDATGSPSGTAHASAYVDQCSALSPSFLHEPAVVLSGVGTHVGQTDAKANIVLHLGYSYCALSARYAFAWTDQRGEVLDTATVPVSKLSLAASRRKAFWCMWTRGQRWKISYVGDVHSTISKLGAMQTEEMRDWDWVIAKVMQADNASHENRFEDTPKFNVVRRFPPVEPAGGDDLPDLYTDHPTPATPGHLNAPSQIGSSKASVSMDIKLPPVSSVTIIDVTEADEHVLIEVSERPDCSSRNEFAVVSRTGLSDRSGIQACAVLARFEEDGVKALELNMLRHYGRQKVAEDMSDERPSWDAHDAQTIATCIAINFNQLRYVGAPPSLPRGRWLSKYPVHLDIVRRLGTQMESVHKHSFPLNVGASK